MLQEFLALFIENMFIFSIGIYVKVMTFDQVGFIVNVVVVAVHQKDTTQMREIQQKCYILKRHFCSFAASKLSHNYFLALNSYCSSSCFKLCKIWQSTVTGSTVNLNCLKLLLTVQPAQ